MKAPVSFIIVGAGNRGEAYAKFAMDFPRKARIVAVAEPNDERRQRLAAAHEIPPERQFRDWRDLPENTKLADAAVVATQDAQHAGPAISLARQGYHLLLEKPLAPTAAESRRIIEAVQKEDILFAVCHVLRYTHYTKKLKELVDNGRIGTLINIQHLEPVGYYHQAHSFVRGNWRREADSSPMLLAKSCHDLDWIRHIIDTSCLQVASFGALTHFRPQNKPAAAGDAVRCLDCAIADDCPYDAGNIYLQRIKAGETGWPVNTITHELSEAGVLQALRTGPYGECVYLGRNDVVDHQVVNLQFVDGRTASFTMTAFTEMAHRQTRLHGTHGQIVGDGQFIELFDFRTETRTRIDTQVGDDATINSGHGGGDYGLMHAFTTAVAANDPAPILSGAAESLESHLMVFAAEQARLENRVVQLSELMNRS